MAAFGPLLRRFPGRKKNLLCYPMQAAQRAIDDSDSYLCAHNFDLATRSERRRPHSQQFLRGIIEE